MSKGKEIAGLLFLIIAVIVAFPQQSLSIFKNRFYIMIGVLTIFVVMFLVWLRLRTRY